MRKLLLASLFLVIAAFGVVLAVIEIDSVIEWQRITAWPTVDGVVIESAVAGQRAIHPRVVYEYAVAGVTYVSESDLQAPMFGGKRKKYDVAKELVAEYPVGRAVTVHYDPDSAACSVLIAEVPWNVYGKLGLGITLCLLGTYGLTRRVLAIRSRP